ncbi:hypothetical protein [Lactococcus lactis]|uniref:Phage protein n=3 Tax=Lactococcus lactis TaxID=1358 RepID=A0AAW8U8V1_9LACT|nr:hypothetical protein [Lactococcus lactis]MDT2879884.1 hypothetical protein [Lactococcus lactis]MDT2944633.1 hypothetical protein [Lactococcus lactis]
MYIKKPKANYLGLSHDQWLKLRDILAIIMRHKPQPYQSNLIMSALNKIEDKAQRSIFECYYFKREGIVSIAKSRGLTERVVGQLLIRAVQAFIEQYDDGHLLLMFKDSELENEETE